MVLSYESYNDIGDKDKNKISKLETDMKLVKEGINKIFLLNHNYMEDNSHMLTILTKKKTNFDNYFIIISVSSMGFELLCIFMLTAVQYEILLNDRHC